MSPGANGPTDFTKPERRHFQQSCCVAMGFTRLHLQKLAEFSSRFSGGECRNGLQLRGHCPTT